MSNASSEEPLVERLAEEFLERRRAGENPSIEEYCRKYPDLEEQIRSFFPALLLVEDLKPDSKDVTGTFSDERQFQGKKLDRVGDYRIIREVGRGGMGVVYEAEQESLRRRVALKVLPRHSATDEKSLERFQREARAAARMHHTNIVPVFEVGEDEEWVYYAMQLIQGQGLDLVIDDLKRIRSEYSTRNSDPDAPSVRVADAPPAHSIAASLVRGRFEQENLAQDAEVEDRRSQVGKRQTSETPTSDHRPPSSDSEALRAHAETIQYGSGSTISAVLPGQSELSSAETNRSGYFQSVAHIGLQTARALSYAHARGIIHRDIKPSNLLLDSAGTVWVTDFGLAKTGDEAMTHTGDILGTIRYMSPERFRGQCDVRADVYALGLTMYEMLALKPAFSSPDRLKLIDLIASTEAPSPRAKDPRVPRDLETIVFKCIDKDPKRRYQSADELSDDLQRFIDDEPIKARRISVVERFARWARHNRGLAASLSAIALLLVVGFVASAVAAHHFRNQQQTTDVARQDAVDARGKEEELRRGAQAAAARERTLKELARDNATRLLTQQKQLRKQQAELTKGLYRAEMNATLTGFGWEPSIEARRTVNRWARPIAGRDPRGPEWYFASAAYRKPGLELKGHQGRIRDLCWSPDGKRIATGGEDKTIRIWDRATGRMEQLWRTKLPVTAIAWHRDGRRIVSGDNDGITEWYVATGEQIRSLAVPRSDQSKFRPHPVVFSNDGTLLAVASRNSIQLLDADSWTIRKNWVAGSEHVSAIAWKQDDSLLASGHGFTSGAGGGTTVTLWNPRTGKRRKELSEKTSSEVCDIAFRSGHDELYFASFVGGVQRGNYKTGKLDKPLSTFYRTLSVASHPKGNKVAWVDIYAKLHVSDGTGGSAETYLTNNSQPTRVRFDPTGEYLALGDASGGLHIVSADGRSATSHKLGSAATAWSWSGDGRRLAINIRNEVTVWNADAKTRIRKLKGLDGKVADIALNRDGSLLAVVQGDGIVIGVYDVNTGKKLQVLKRHRATKPKRSLSLEWHPTRDLLASAGYDGRVIVWTAQDAKPLRVLRLGRRVSSIRWSRDGKRVAATILTSPSGTLRIWDAGNWTLLRDIPVPDFSVTSVAWSPDGSRLSAVYETNKVGVWDAGSGKMLHRIAMPYSAGTPTWTSDGSRLLVTGSVSRIIDAQTGEQVGQLPLLTTSAEPSPDGRKLLVSSRYGGSRLYDATPVLRASRSPQVLPLLAEEIAAGDEPARLLAARIHARRNRWDEAEALLAKPAHGKRPGRSERPGRSGREWYAMDWWSLKHSLPNPWRTLPASAKPADAGQSDPDAPSVRVAAADLRWYAAADDPNGFVSNTGVTPFLATRIYARQPVEIFLRDADESVGDVRLNGELVEKVGDLRILKLRTGWNALLARVDFQQYHLGQGKAGASLWLDDGIAFVAYRLQNKQWNEALAVITRLRETDPRNPRLLPAEYEARRHIGLAHHKAGRLDEAVKQFRRTLALAERDKTGTIAARQRFAAAECDLGLALARQKTDPDAGSVRVAQDDEAHRLLIDGLACLNLEGRPEWFSAVRVATVAERILKRSPTNLLALRTAGAALRSQGKTDEARRYLEKSLALSPFDKRVGGELARTIVDSREPAWVPLKLTRLNSFGNATLTELKDGSVLAGGKHVSGDTYTITGTSAVTEIRAVRLEALPDDSLPRRGPGRHVSGNFQLAAFRLLAAANGDDGNPVPVPLSDVWASYQYAYADISGTIDQTRRTVWHVAGRPGQRHFAVYLLKEPLRLPEGRKLTVELKHRDKHNGINLGRFRLSVTDSASVPANNAAWTRRENIRQKKFDGFAALGAAYVIEGKTQQARTRLEQVVSSDPANAVAVTELATLVLAKHKTDWQVLQPVEMKGKAGETLTLEKDGGIFVSGPNPNRAVYTLKLRTDLPTVTAIRLETLPDARLPEAGAGRYHTNGNFHLSEFTVAISEVGRLSKAVATEGRATAAKPQPIPIVAAITDFRANRNFGILKAIDGDPRTRWGTRPRHALPHWAIFRFETPVKTSGRFLVVTLDSGISPWGKHGLGRFRISATSNPLPIWSRTPAVQRNAWAGLAAAYAVDGATEKAASAFVAAFDQAKDDASRKRILQLAAQFDGVVTGLLVRYPKEPVLLTAAARVDRIQNRPAEARKRLEQALSIDPKHSDAAGELATVMLDGMRPEWQVLKPVEMKSEGGATLTMLNDGSILASGKTPDHEAYTIVAHTKLKKVTAIRLEALTHQSLPRTGPGRFFTGEFVLTSFSLRAAPESNPKQATPVPFAEAAADYSFPRQPINARKNGSGFWHIAGGTGKSHVAIFRPKNVLVIKDGSRLEFRLSFKLGPQWTKRGLGRFRLSVSDDPNAFQRETKSLVTVNVTNPWEKLGAVYAIEGKTQPAIEAFTTAFYQAKNDADRKQVLRLAVRFDDIVRLAVRFDDIVEQLLSRRPIDPALLTGELSRSEPLLLALYATLNKQKPPSSLSLIMAVRRLTQLYEDTGKNQDAAKWKAELKRLQADAIARTAKAAAAVAKKDVSGEITDPNRKFGGGANYRLVGDATFGWKTGKLQGNVDLNGHSFTMDTGGGNRAEFSGVIAGKGNFVWNGGGAGRYQTLPSFLSGDRPNTFSGTLTILRGTLVFSKPNEVCAFAGSRLVLGGGSNQTILQLRSSEQIDDACTVAITGNHEGRIWTQGHSETVGRLELQSSGYIDLGDGNSRLQFADSSKSPWDLSKTLTIQNWTRGKDVVRFGTTASGLNAGQLARIGFANPSGRPAGWYSAKILADGSVIPDRLIQAAKTAFDVSAKARSARAAIYQVSGRANLSGAKTPLRDGMRISFFGDSITWQNKYIGKIHQALNAGEGTKRFNISLINRGINGGGVLSIRDGSKKSAYVNARNRDGKQAAFAEVLAADRADVAVVFIGINDVWWRNTSPAVFEKALRDLVAASRANRTALVLATLAVNQEKPDGSNPMDKKCDQYAEITRKVARSTGTTLVDLRRVFLAYLRNHNAELRVDGSVNYVSKGILTYDGVHPNATGNDLIADHIGQGIYAVLTKAGQKPPVQARKPGKRSIQP
jgi:autotransporter-associated beta strand protein